MERDHGVSVERYTVRDRVLIYFTRLHGDQLREASLVDVPVRLTTGMLIAYCRDLGLQCADFGLTPHDMMSADMNPN